MHDDEPCPCGGVRYAACCGPLLSGEVIATSATALMRSRYTAFVRGDAAYLLTSWHPSTRPAVIEFDDRRWLGLRIVASTQGEDGDPEGSVEFVARYKLGSRGYRMREVSRFTRHQGRWVYLDGDVS